MTTKCVQCGGTATIKIQWLAKPSQTENVPQQAYVCDPCLRMLWSKYAHTQFGETLQIDPLEG